jgi:hypothetical protein
MSIDVLLSSIHFSTPAKLPNPCCNLDERIIFNGTRLTVHHMFLCLLWEYICPNFVKTDDAWVVIRCLEQHVLNSKPLKLRFVRAHPFFDHLLDFVHDFRYSMSYTSARTVGNSSAAIPPKSSTSMI